MTPPKSPPQPAVSVEQLLPCPFCGSDEGLTIGETKCTALVRWWSVECHGCCVSNTANTESEAIAEWNTRAPASAAPPTDGVLRGVLIEARQWVEANTASVRGLSSEAAKPGEAMLRKIDAVLSRAAPKTPTAPIGEAAVSAAKLRGMAGALEAVRAAMLNGGDGTTGDFGWSITKLNKARPLILAALAGGSHD